MQKPQRRHAIYSPTLPTISDLSSNLTLARPDESPDCAAIVFWFVNCGDTIVSGAGSPMSVVSFEYGSRNLDERRTLIKKKVAAARYAVPAEFEAAGLTFYVRGVSGCGGKCTPLLPILTCWIMSDVHYPSMDYRGAEYRLGDFGKAGYSAVWCKCRKVRQFCVASKDFAEMLRYRCEGTKQTVLKYTGDWIGNYT
ncbi:hypothetical protein F4778DRAFT_744723 [Xylariomycetidae sp. FL2044]|nr:hypothetical protein F4778DRAFT_744723 [Xylariomycetidae sp. FL2044]